MPFPAHWIEERLAHAASSGRLGHAYLLTGAPLSELEASFDRIRLQLLGDSDSNHPDYHHLRPESKSRRVSVDQIRQLEHLLQLKSHRAGVKVAAISAADRMCVPPASAANAFLKTLEEPPSHSVIFLLSDRPAEILPTIRSRCLVLNLHPENPPQPAPALAEWIERWLRVDGPAPDRAYTRSSMLISYWHELRDQVSTQLPKSDEVDEKEWKALVESRFLQLRDEQMQFLIEMLWNKLSAEDIFQAMRACESLESLRTALLRNIDAGLATDRCMLKFEGVL